MTGTHGSFDASVDVVVPSYNHARFVEDCLRSIFAQTVKPARLLVIDDGSTDRSPRIIEKTLHDCPFPCELIVRENRGLCASLNEALDRTTAPFFAYLGSDDMWVPHRIETALSLFAGDPGAVLAHSNFFVCDADGRITFNAADARKSTPQDMFHSMMRVRHVPQSSTVTYRRSAVEKFRWDERARLEDYLMYLRLAREGGFAFSPEPLAYWRHHEDNTHKQVELILAALLDGQRQAALEAGWDRDLLKAYQGMVRFSYASQMLRHGKRARAAWLTLASARYAPSGRVLMKRIRHLVTPRRLLSFPDA